MGKTKDLSKVCKNIVLNLFKFFQHEKARGRPLYSPEHARLLAYLTVLWVKIGENVKFQMSAAIIKGYG
jgi:hypothetical protein